MDAAIEPKVVQKRRTFRIRNFLSTLGPGLITGASDDDPSGIGTYSQAGAQLGFGVGWTMLLSYPLMAAIQEIPGRILATIFELAVASDGAGHNLKRRTNRPTACDQNDRTLRQDLIKDNHADRQKRPQSQQRM
ncbi:hypothetical protein ABIB81_009461 [Bradyrhizobium sp. I1.7.5]